MYRDPKEVEREVLEERLKRAQLDDYQVSSINLFFLNLAFRLPKFWT